MFYFQELLNKGLAGIDQTAMITTVIAIAYTILIVGFLIGIYHAAIRGGDLQSLGITAIKYLAIAIILANWSSAFREVNGSFNQVAQYIDNASGAGDMFLSWFDQLKQQFAANGISALLPAISGTWAAISTALAILTAYVIYAMMVVIFAFFYVLYGCVLYVLGPLVLALLPMPGVGQLAKSYATNLMIWNAWGILYAMFGSLITAIQFNRVDQVMNQGFLTGFFQGSGDTAILGMVSIFYALALGLIPLVAKKLIAGDVGSTVYSLVKAGAVAVGAAVSAAAGVSAGAGAESSAGSGAAGGASDGGAAALSSAGGGAGASSSSNPPPQPSIASTIRSGVMSALNGNAPQAPSPDSTSSDATAQSDSAPSSADGSGGPGARSGTSSSSRGDSRSSSRSAAQPRYSNSSLTNVAAFHVGRFAGQAVKSAVSNGNKKDEDG